MTAWKWVSLSVVAASLLTARGDAGGGIFFPDPEYVALNSSYPSNLATGPSGDIWFTENNADRIGRIAADGHLDEFPLPEAEGEFRASPTAITLGADGNLWFIESGPRKIGRITPTGTVTEFAIPSPLNLPFGITSGPDGKVWFTELAALRGVPQSGVVGNISVNGTINEISIDAPAFKIVSGPDDALWFTTDGLGRMTTNGQYRVFPIDVIGTYDIFATYDVTVGPDGALWFTYFRSVPQPPGDPAGLSSEPTIPVVGRMTTDGVVTSFLSSDPYVQPVAITRGPEDNLWFTTQAGGIWRVNLAGTLDQIVVDGDGSDPVFDITAGADGRMWYTLPQSDRIGSIDSLFFLPVNLSAGAAPIGLTRAPDDSVWFADYSGSRVGRIDKNGGLQQYELGAEHNPTAVAVAPDGSAWFTDPGGENIGLITTDGEVSFTTIQSLPSAPQDIVLGPDGNFWFTEYQAGAISRLTPQSGAIKRFPIPHPNPNVAGPQLEAAVPNPLNITVGPDGNLWFSDCGLGTIGRLTPHGDTVDIVEFPIPTDGSGPAGITAGADGNLYFVESNAGRVARITTAGVVTELGTSNPDSYPQYITLGPDGAIWFTESDANRLGRIARDGRITHFDLPTADSAPNGIVGRSDGRLFVALLNISQILYTDLAAAEPTHTVTPTATATRPRTPTSTRTPTLTVPPGSTATSTPPATATDTVTRTPTVTVTVPPGSTATETPEIIDLPCVGDCDGDETVSISELITGVNIALGNTLIEACINADAFRDGEVRINDLIIAVTDALQGCPL